MYDHDAKSADVDVLKRRVVVLFDYCFVHNTQSWSFGFIAVASPRLMLCYGKQIHNCVACPHVHVLHGPALYITPSTHSPSYLILFCSVLIFFYNARLKFSCHFRTRGRNFLTSGILRLSRVLFIFECKINSLTHERKFVTFSHQTITDKCGHQQNQITKPMIRHDNKITARRQTGANYPRSSQ